MKTYDVLMTPSDNGAWVLKSAANRLIAKQKYKRCLAMAEWCDAEMYAYPPFGTESPKEKWWQKWHTRWLKYAEIIKSKWELK